MRFFLFVFFGIFLGLYLSWPGLVVPENWKCFNQIIESCICIEGNCALHIKNDFDYSSIDFGNGKNCFRVARENNIVKKKIL